MLHLLFKKEKTTLTNPEPPEDVTFLGQINGREEALSKAEELNKSEIKSLNPDKDIVRGNREDVYVIPKEDYVQAREKLIQEHERKQAWLRGEIPD